MLVNISLIITNIALLYLYFTIYIRCKNLEKKYFILMDLKNRSN